VSIIVAPVNDAPTAFDDVLTGIAEDPGADRTIPFADLIGNDSKGPANESPQALTITAVGNAVGGTVSIVGTDVIFSPAQDFNGTASFEYTVEDNGQSGDPPADDFKTDIGLVTFAVTAVNDAPVNSTPAAQSMGQGGTLVFSSGGGNAISTNDVDAGAAAVLVSLSVSDGTFSLASTTGLSFTVGDGAADPAMTFTGALADVNAALDGMTYSPGPTFTGDATLTLNVNDQGNTGAGGALFDEDTVTISVTSTNDPPTADSQTVSVDEGDSVEITLSASDDNTADEDLVFTITSVPSNGTLFSGSEIVEVGDTFTGAPTLTYAPGDCGCTSDSFTFTVTDDGTPALTSDPATASIDIVPAVGNGQVVVADGTLLVGGTAGNDTIQIVGGFAGPSWVVTVNGITTIVSGIDEMRVWGRDGNDVILLSNTFVDSALYGGNGNDIIFGNGGADIIFGGAGNDGVNGGTGNDVVIGGAGADAVLGNAGHDILIAGDVADTFSEDMLRDIGAAWASNRTADGAPDDGSVDETVTDNSFDVLVGGSGADWFIVQATDLILDFLPFGVNADRRTNV
jgi:Ca2+-binding RTX toxin-like protein